MALCFGASFTGGIGAASAFTTGTISGAFSVGAFGLSTASFRVGMPSTIASSSLEIRESRLSLEVLRVSSHIFTSVISATVRLISLDF
jgi:hypothetical protein